MYNPKKIWLLYAKKLYELLRKNRKEIPILLKANLDEVIKEYKFNLDEEQKERLLEIAMAFFQEEYLESYRLASKGEEPDNELSTIQTCVVVEETLGYPVTDVFKQMVQEIINDRDKSEEEVTDILIKKYGAYPAQAILKIDLKDTVIPENHLPDFCLAKSIQTIVDQYISSKNN